MANSDGRASADHLDQRQMRKNVLGGYLSKFATVFVAIVTTRLYFSYLGDERFGLWMTLGLIAQIMPIGDLGVGQAISIQLAKALSVDDQAAVRRVCSTGFFLLAGLGLAMTILSLLIFPLIPWAQWLQLKSDLAKAEALPAVLVLFISMAVLVPLNFGFMLLAGFQEHLRRNVWLGIGLLAQIIPGVIAVQMNLSLPFVVFTAAGFPGFFWLAMTIHELWFRKRDLLPKWSEFDRGCAKELFTLGNQLLLSQTARTAAVSINPIVVATVFGVANVPQFGTLARLFFMGQISQYASGAWTTAFAASFESGNEQAASQYLKSTLKKYGAITVLIAVALVLGGPFILKLWLGDKIGNPPLPLLIAFGFWCVAWTFVDALTSYATAGRFVRIHTILFTVSTIVICAAMFATARWFGMTAILWTFTIGITVLFLIPLGIKVGVLSPKQKNGTSGRGESAIGKD